MYYDYTQARDMVWKILIQENVTELPVKISALCKNAGAKVLSYSKKRALLDKLDLLKHSKKTDGFTLSYRGQYIIFYNDVCSAPRIRFTLAHELGHILLGHISPGEVTLINREPSPRDNPLEQAANVFASRLLAPACVLWGLGVTTAKQIMDICDISRTAAEFRAERMQALYERDLQFRATRGKGCFLLSPLERQAYEQFRPYIDRNRL